MIRVGNVSQRGAGVGYALSQKKIPIERLGEPEGILHIDPKVRGEAEAQDEAPEIKTNAGAKEIVEEESEAPAKKQTRQQRAESLRKIVDTVGQVGQPGEKIHAVISVGMLSEGWDAKTVTHIMRLRAFTSQLLCEQVVGRRLRRTSYDVDPKTRLFTPEYDTICGVPFTFIPHDGVEA